MKYIEICLNERQKELENKRKRYIELIKEDIKNKTEKEIAENIITDYVIWLVEIYDSLEELDRLRKDLLGSDKE